MISEFVQYILTGKIKHKNNWRKRK